MTQKKRLTQIILILMAVGAVVGKILFSPEQIKEDDGLIAFADVKQQSFPVEVRTVGELEAAQSTVIASTIRGDLGKLIYLVQDGINVNAGDLLVKMDPSPFEEKIQELAAKIKDQEANIIALQQALEWDQNQVALEAKTVAFEVESAELELNKVLQGDGPQEISKLKSAMKKAFSKFEEFNGYSLELQALQEQGYINIAELKNALKKLEEEREAYESAKMQYDSFVNHVHPMQVKKAQTSLEKTKVKQEESSKSGIYKITKSTANLQQAKQAVNDLHWQLKNAKRELELSEIRAQNQGMAVLREDFRQGQRRKPRVGDVLVRNQALLDLPDLESMIVKTKVREVDLYKIEINKPATIEVDAYPQAYFTGKVISIGVLALADLGRTNDEKYFEVKVGFDKSDPRLRPGMTSRVVVHADDVKDKIAIPFHALFDDNKKPFCYVPVWGGYEKRVIEVGVSNEHWVEIKSGLKQGEKVCLSSPAKKEIVRE